MLWFLTILNVKIKYYINNFLIFFIEFILKLLFDQSNGVSKILIIIIFFHNQRFYYPIIIGQRLIIKNQEIEKK